MGTIQTMQKTLAFLIVSLLTFLLSGIPVQAATPAVTPQPQTPAASAPPLLITAFGGDAIVEFVELYNQSDKPVNLAGRSLEFTVAEKTNSATVRQATILLPEGWLLPKGYLTLQLNGNPPSVSFTIDQTILSGLTDPRLALLRLYDASLVVRQEITLPQTTAGTWMQHKKRNNAASTARTITGNFALDFDVKTGTPTLFSDPLYLPPSAAGGLQILEILPNARDCPPLEVGADCNDYIKVYNPTAEAIDLSLFRLRVGAAGQNESVTNTFTWGAGGAEKLLLLPGEYHALAVRDDGMPLSLTNTGAFVWLEDAYGAVSYEPVTQYPDASADSKKGHAWAFDGQAWRWTSHPQPYGANYIPQQTDVAAEGTTLVPCREGQERNPDTNRCRSGAVAAASLAACPPGQERNPATNRCRALVAAASSLTPCGPGQERNPETNRCRSVATADATLKPCTAGQERNPETNRCRKAAAASSQKPVAVQDVAASTAADTVGWWFAGVVGIGTLSYAAFEWRQEIRQWLGRVKHKIRRTPPA
jgi:hypothetical protein